MGNLFSAEPGFDPEQIAQMHKAEMERKEREYRAQRERDNAAFQKMFDDLKTATADDRQQFQREFQAQQLKIEQERTAERKRYEESIFSLLEAKNEAEAQTRKFAELLDKPVKEREKKVAFVNGLNLKIRQTESLLLAGPKGLGKSTFLWLLNKGPMPQQTPTDGTVAIIHAEGFMDSIGLIGWSPEDLLKMLVLLIYEGIPKDLIIFTNDRVTFPIVALGRFGIINPMIVIMSSEFWTEYQPVDADDKRITLVQTNDGVRKVEPETGLRYLYKLKVYDAISKLNLGTPVTHHHDLKKMVNIRHNAGIRPFQFLTDQWGDQFTVAMESTFDHMEALFRFIYIFENRYGRDQQKFMNYAKLQDFQ